MYLKDLDFKLPSRLIASFPLKNRSDSKLLLINKMISDHWFKDLPKLLKPHDVLVINDTAVMKARLFARKSSGAKVEILIERILEETKVIAQTKSNSKLKQGDILSLANKGPDLVLGKKKGHLFYISFPESVLKLLEDFGQVPLPPYIKRKPISLDNIRYQTIYANLNNPSSVAAPTAGLHFDETLLTSLVSVGVKLAKISLKIGMGTFQPIRESIVENHKIHKELIEIDKTSIDLIKESKKRNGRVICVGTTSLRCIESVCEKNEGKLTPFKGETDLFIYPGYKFQLVDGLITNFHLPRSSLLLLVSAFAGHKRIMSAYNYAIKNQYRFYSYGDAMFINPKDINKK